MRNILLILIFAVCYTNNINYQLLDELYDEKNWILDETLEHDSKIYVKNINDINLKAIKISRDIEIDPVDVLNVIKNVQDYNQVLINSTNVVTTPIQSENEIIAKQYISIPIFSDLYFFFKIYESPNKVYWLLENPTDYIEYIESAHPLSIGCGGWDYKKNPNGTYKISYTLIFDIDGYPNWVVNYLNYYSLINVYNDVIAATLKIGNK